MTATCRLPLEDFSAFTKPRDAESNAPSHDYLKGFEDGALAGEKAAESRHVILTDSLVSRLEDIAFTHAEARQHVLTSIKPIIEQLSELVVPALLSETFTARLSAEIVSKLDAATDGQLSLHVALPQLETVQNLVEASGLASITVIADSRLAKDQARFSGWECEGLLDLPALSEALRLALAGIELDKRTSEHG